MLGTNAYAVTAILRWPEMEQIMSKTNDTSNLATLEEHVAVSGGLVVIAAIAVLIHLLLPSDAGSKPA
jgi:hypothetical protein